MTDNSIKVNNEEIYLHDIYYYADEFIQNELDGDKTRVKDSFKAMILYIADNINKPSNEDIELLDYIFNIYVRLCSKYNVNPTLYVYGFLVKIDYNTFTDWMNGVYRSSTPHGCTAKKWFNICKSFVIDTLHNQAGTNANLIFTAKAAYGMVETAPVQTVNQSQMILGVSDLPQLGSELSDNMPEIIEDRSS